MTDSSTPGQSSRTDREAVLDRVTDAVFALDQDWRFTYVDDEAEAAFGREEAELLGKVIWEAFPEMVDSMFQWEFERAMETGESLVFETRYRPASAWFEVDVYPSENGLSVFVRDVTDPEERQQELETREQALRRAYEVIADKDSTFDDRIDSLLELVRSTLGTPFATLSRVDVGADEYVFEHVAVREDVGLEPGDTTPLASLPNCAKVVRTAETLVLQDVAAEAPELDDPEWGISCYLGSPVVVDDEVYGTFCFYGMDARSEEFSDWEVTFIDLLSNWVGYELEQQAYERRLEQSNEELEQFAYAASHDLQEPLRMVSSYVGLIERNYGDQLDEEGREFLEFAVDGADRMREMIDGLLAYSRVDTRGSPMEPLDLDDVLEAVYSDLKFKIEESGADVSSTSLPRVVGDANQLRQLFQNLLDNAISYSGDEPPVVHVSAERTDGEVAVSVRDEGVGFDQADADRVFEVFQSLHTPEEGGGTGIGLALCKRIVERHDGDLRVETAPDEGATFRFTLPAADPEA